MRRYSIQYLLLGDPSRPSVESASSCTSATLALSLVATSHWSVFSISVFGQIFRQIELINKTIFLLLKWYLRRVELVMLSRIDNVKIIIQMSNLILYGNIILVLIQILLHSSTLSTAISTLRRRSPSGLWSVLILLIVN